MENVEIITLENGLKVVLKQIADTKEVAIGLWVNQAVNVENEKTNGINNLLRSVLLEGHLIGSEILIKHLIEKIKLDGGKFHSMTNKENTYFVISSNKKNFHLILKIVASLLLFENIKYKNFVSQKKLIEEEIKKNETSPFNIKEDILQTLWGNIGIGKKINGTIYSLENINYDKVLSNFQNNYITNNMVLIIIGNYNKNKLLKLLYKYFININSGKKKMIFNRTGDFPGFIKKKKLNDNIKSILGLGFKSFSLNDAGFIYTDIFKYIFNKNLIKLFNDIDNFKNFVSKNKEIVFLKRTDNEIKENPFCFTEILSNNGALGYCVIFIEDKELEGVTKSVFKLINFIGENGFNFEDFEKIYLDLLKVIKSKVNDPFSQVLFSGNFIINNKMYFLNNYAEDLNSINFNQFNEKAKEIFNLDNIGLVIYNTIELDKIIKIIN